MEQGKYKKTTDVQATWKEYGWRPPSEDPLIVAKWHFFQTVGVQGMETPPPATETD